MALRREVIAAELFALVTDRFRREGIHPDDPEVRKIIASMLAAHYLMRGASDEALQEIIVEVEFRCALAREEYVP